MAWKFHVNSRGYIDTQGRFDIDTKGDGSGDTLYESGVAGDAAGRVGNGQVRAIGDYYSAINVGPSVNIRRD